MSSQAIDRHSPHKPAPRHEAAFHHEAVFYSDVDDFLAATAPFVRGALEREEPVLVAVTRSKTRALQGELGEGAELVRFADMEQLGRNPARIIPAWQAFVDEHASPTQPVRGIGEPIWRGRSPAELTECHRHEALLNLAFAGAPAWELLCPYDATALDDDTLAAACDTHPHISERGRMCDSSSYVCAHAAPQPFSGTLPHPSQGPAEMRFRCEQLAAVRRFVAKHAARAGLSRARASDLVLAVSELAGNSVCHGGGGGTLLIWQEGGALVCEVRDGGAIHDPLAGRLNPSPRQSRGRGLWVVNQICDLVQIRSEAPGGQAGTAIRVHMYLD